METVFVTGASGAIGPQLLAALARELPTARFAVLLRPEATSTESRIFGLRKRVNKLAGFEGAAACDLHERLMPVTGDVLQPDCDILKQRGRLVAATTCIVHAAADTRFRAGEAEQHATNVEGTRNVLAWGRSCERLRRFVLVSTTCVAGTRTGTIAEEPITERPAFVNHYERTKWEAEQLGVKSGLPLTIVRLATCAGSQNSGVVERLGGLHWSMQWMIRGLVPMVPGRPECPVDLISTELAGGLIARAAAPQNQRPLEVCHASTGTAAPTLAELLATLRQLFSSRDDAWRRGQIAAPSIVSAQTFAAFRRTVETSGDLLFRSVISSVDAFLPALLYPKIFATSTAEQIWGGPLPRPDWRGLLDKVLNYCLATNWGRTKGGVPLHA